MFGLKSNERTRGRDMTRYDIHTRNKDQKWIQELLGIGFDGFTIVKGDGYWADSTEKSLVITIYTENRRLIRTMAECIKSHTGQDDILVTETDCKLVLV
jgi:hypothetical protein